VHALIYRISISPETDDKMKRAILRGGYKSEDQFILHSIENQIREELDSEVVVYGSREASVFANREQEIFRRAAIDSSASRNLIAPSPRTPVTVENPNSSMLSQLPLWGQLYKFLPTKLGLRVLCNLTLTSTVSYKEFREAAAKEAVLFKGKLVKKDRSLGNKFGEELATAFPDDNDKSIRRYQDQYLVYARPNVEQISSLAAQMKWLSVDSKRKVGITKLGLEFAKLSNPIIDADGDEPLSQEEKMCIIDQIIEMYRAEASQMEFVLEQISSGISSRQMLNQRLVQFYRKNWSNESKQWKEGLFNTMRAGEIGRLYELRLVSKTRDGLNVSYAITEDGKKILDRLKREIQGTGAK
jgi:hypothetical protein